MIDVAELVATRLDRRLVLVRDPDDAVVAEAAIDAGVDHLVTHNLRQFGEVADVLSVVTPGELLRVVADKSDEREGRGPPQDVNVAQEGSGATGV